MHTYRQTDRQTDREEEKEAEEEELEKYFKDVYLDLRSLKCCQLSRIKVTIKKNIAYLLKHDLA